LRGHSVAYRMTVRSRPGRLVVVTGTGTEVGKTWVSAAVLRLARAQGLSVAARKPAQSFAPDQGPDQRDAYLLAAATGEPADVVCRPERSYPVPMAPPMAAEALGRFGKLNVRFGKGSRRRGPKPRLCRHFCQQCHGPCCRQSGSSQALGADPELPRDTARRGSDHRQPPLRRMAARNWLPLAGPEGFRECRTSVQKNRA